MSRRSYRKPRICLVAFLLSLIILLPLSGCVTKTAQYGRVSKLTYYVRLMPKDGEMLPPMTIYVPFTHQDGKLAEELLQSVRADYEKGKQFFKDKPQDYPVLTFTSIETQYGQMLKIESKTASRGISATGNYTYATALPIGRADTKYPLKPTIVKGKKEKAPIYVEYEGGTGVYVWLVYQAYTWDAYVEMLPTKFGDSWIVGKSATPSSPGDVYFPSTYEKDKIWLEKQGWNKIPVWR